MDLVTIRSDKWVHYDPSGKLGPVDEDGESSAAQAANGVEEDRAVVRARCCVVEPQWANGVGHSLLCWLLVQFDPRLLLLTVKEY